MQAFRELLLFDIPGTAQHDGIGIFDLILKEFPEVLSVLFGLLGIHYGDAGVQPDIRMLGHTLHGLFHVGEFAHAGGLDQNALGMELLHHLDQRVPEISHERAADAAGIHLGDLHTGLSQEAAVDADLTEFVFDQYDLMTLEYLFQQFLDKGGLSSAKEPGDHINFCHFFPLF